ncbi:MAG TPA: class I SAM-dependent methyltransferase, partial [Pseudonocardiaceae bacterium]
MGIVAAINRFNQARPWSHNNFYHRWILRQLPRSVSSALDVGCGSGDLVALLAARSASVLGVDRAAVIENARPLPNVRYVHADVFDLPEDRYDVITCVAALHHLPLEQALATFRRWLAPGGTLVVIGLAAPTVADYLMMLVATPANMLI